MRKFLPYLGIAVSLILVVLLGQQNTAIHEFIHHNGEAEMLLIFFEMSLMLSLSALVIYVSSQTILPSFVVAIFFGIAARPLLGSITGNQEVLSTIVGLGATLILFGGGLEVPFKNFKRLFWKILSLSFIGLGLTALLFSGSLLPISGLLGSPLTAVTVVLLGAILASTDPAAIIPVLKVLRFKNRDTKDIIISESAMTDVTGTLLTIAFLTMASTGVVFQTDMLANFGLLFSRETASILGMQILFGVIFGIFGWGLLELFVKFKKKQGSENEADAAFFLFIPIIVFTVALLFGGSGYLAAFIAGLLLILSEHLKETEHFFNRTIDGFLKPFIFLLLGALVDPAAMISYAGIGLVAAFIFMFIIRPIAVFVSLAPFKLFKNEELKWKDLVFISFVRETGAIPAVLLVTVVSSGITGIEGLLPIGMWVILCTLIIQPPLTPLVAKVLGVADKIENNDEDEVVLKKQSAVLATRGNSYERRLPVAMEWCMKHNIHELLILNCMEDKYTQEKANEITKNATVAAADYNAKNHNEGLPQVNLSIVHHRGLLEENVAKLSNEEKKLSVIFVGRRVLDFRLEHFKTMNIPIRFLD
ncbi:MAG: cation:proton antiporter [Candidatus Gracilibacteria bacterium]